VRLLVLGGTVFLGRAVVEAALTGGHTVTTFTRGRTNPDLFPEAEPLRGDRDGDLGALEGREWDAVIDTCGFVPRVVRQSADLLDGRVGRCVFVSSVSAYDDASTPPDEAAARLAGPPAGEDVMKEYGALKAACEDVVRDVFGDAATIVRPGLIVGPHDPTGRFTYWPRRIADGGRVLAPGPPEAPVQVIDVRDLGAWLLRLAERGPGGVFNATGPVEPLTMRELLEGMCTAIGSDAELVWVDDETLLEAEVEPWMGLPLWLPGDEHAGMMRTPIARALAAGLQLRPVRETVLDTLAWDRSMGGVAPRQPDGRYTAQTLTREREEELLAER